MSLEFWHGPAGGGKTEKLIELICQNEIGDFSHPNSALIVPDSPAVEIYQKKILAKKGGRGFFSGNTISTFEDFLFEGLKASLPRLHRATPRFSRQVLRKLLFEKNYPTFEDRKHYSGLVFELQRAILQLKKNGLTPGRAQALFKRFLNNELDDFLKIFSDYQNLLDSLDTADEGDCVAKTLNLLSLNRYCFSPSLNTICFDRLFPLSLGHREIFREMHNRYAEKKWIVATSFDYKSDDDPHLYPAFGFMGELAGQTRYFEPQGSSPQPELISFPQSAMEADWIADEISSELNRGLSPDQMGVIVPPFSFTHKRLTKILSARGIPCFNPYRPTLSESLSSSPIPMERLIKTFRGGNQRTLADTLEASSAMEIFMEEWKFDAQRLFSDNIPPETMRGWMTEELEQIRAPRVQGSGGIFLSSLAGSLALDVRRLIVAGFTDKNYPGLSGEHPFFTNEMLERPELREILVSPFYRWSVEKNILSQILRRTKERATLTHPRMDWEGGELFVSRLLGGEIPAETRKTQTQALNPTPLFQKSRFPRLQKKHYGITELEDYLKCPYLYYARHHLKIGEGERDRLDLAPDLTGRFVHQVLEALYKNHLDLYREAIEYDLYLDRFVEVIPSLVDKLMAENSGFTPYPHMLRLQFATRVAKTIDTLARREIQLLREGKKKTIPSTMEWSFGKGTSYPLKIDLEGVDIFLSGRVDRIDIDEKTKTFSIIDYKTGKLPTALSLKDGSSLQIPFYLIAISRLWLKEWRVGSALLVGLKEMERPVGIALIGSGEEELVGKNQRLNPLQWIELQETGITTVAGIVKKINQGDFDPAPRDEALCRTCAYRHICHYKGLES